MKSLKGIRWFTISILLLMNISSKAQDNDFKDIIGVWQSVEDSNWILSFTNDSICTQYYNGILTEKDSFRINNTSPQCNYNVPVDLNTSYLKLTNLSNDNSDSICYEIYGISDTNLSLRVVDKGGFLLFKRLHKLRLSNKLINSLSQTKINEVKNGLEFKLVSVNVGTKNTGLNLLVKNNLSDTIKINKKYNYSSDLNATDFSCLILTVLDKEKNISTPVFHSLSNYQELGFLKIAPGNSVIINITDIDLAFLNNSNFEIQNAKLVLKFSYKTLVNNILEKDISLQ